MADQAGLLHVYYGTGKGKTTAALGLVMRAWGQGMRAAVVQFFKNSPCGEMKALAQLPGVVLLRRTDAGKGFTFAMNEAEKEELNKAHLALMARARELAADCSLVVLDEALDACAASPELEKALREWVEQPLGTELVLTGHQLPDWLYDRADYVTEMTARKHPYDRGVQARRGIEY